MPSAHPDQIIAFNWSRHTRALFLMIDGQVIAEHFLPKDLKGNSRIDVYKLSDSIYVMQDTYGTYNVVATHMLLTEQKPTREKVGGEFIGSFGVDKSKSWRFITAPAKTQPRAPTRIEKQKIVKSKK